MSTAYPASPPTAGGVTASLRRVEAWLDQRGRWAWGTATVAALIFVWPVGLALVAYLIWSRRMFTRTDRRGHAMRPERVYDGWSRHSRLNASSGNSAFDAYRAETLRRLESEQEAFEAFLQRLREAKDKSEFDTFMDERARAASAPRDEQVA